MNATQSRIDTARLRNAGRLARVLIQTNRDAGLTDDDILLVDLSDPAIRRLAENLASTGVRSEVTWRLVPAAIADRLRVRVVQ